MPHATRRSVLSGAAVTGAAALSAAGYAAPSHGVNSAGKSDTVRLTVLGTTDLHGNVFNWDYYKNAEFSNSAGNEIGVAKVKTLIDAVREERSGEPILTIDAGDTIQGTPLAYYYARIDPITAGRDPPDGAGDEPLGYDAAALGNHEFNYGIDTIRKFEEQVNFPMLGANALDPSTSCRSSRPTSSRTTTWAAAAVSASVCSG